MYIRGSLDMISTAGLAGWAYAPDRREGLTVQALLHHEVIGETVANLHRPDLAAVGIGDGNCGYEIRFHSALNPLYLPFVVVKPEGGDVEMPRNSLSGYAEFLQSIYRQWPVAGRHRCVLGGLWTDRTDAPSLLRARVELGTVASGIAETIEMLLSVGLMTPRLAAPASEAEPARAIEHALEAPAVVACLRAVLEDHPLVLSPEFAVEGPFRQPSGVEQLTSPAECVALILPIADALVELEVVRDSHLLAEFGKSGVSRWTSRTGHPGLEMAEAYGLLDRYTVPTDRLTVIGPGLLHRVIAPNEGAVVAIALPARAAPLRRRLRASGEITCPSGARIWL